MDFKGNLKTTAMGILPHTDVKRALDLAFSLDIPFWPQLPKLTYWEDMYVQVSENFPGIRINDVDNRVEFDTGRFMEELPEFLERMEDPEIYRLSEKYSAVYHEFLNRDLSKYYAIRGQVEGPISFGLNVKDENDRPILYNDEVREFMLDFMARKVNVMGEELLAKNPRAFMFVDEPGLEFIFSAMSGFAEDQARSDMDRFFSMVTGRRGVHLCGNPDWDFLLKTKMDVLSFNAFGRGDRFVNYVPSIKSFLDQGGTIGWGLVPANYEEFNSTDIDGLYDQIEGFWDILEKAGIPRERLLPESLLMPATCALVNPDKGETVERCYDVLREISFRLREKYGFRE
jgi:hypothetical protein